MMREITKATGYLWVDGRQVPGSALCEAHAEACLREFGEVLGEVWGFEPVNFNRDGRHPEVIPDCQDCRFGNPLPQKEGA